MVKRGEYQRWCKRCEAPKSYCHECKKILIPSHYQGEEIKVSSNNDLDVYFEKDEEQRNLYWFRNLNKE